MDAFTLHEGAAAAFRLVDATNEFIAATAPWALAKDPRNDARLTQVLFDSAEAIRLAAVHADADHAGVRAEILRRVGRRGDGLTFDRDGHWRAEGERVLAQDGPLWPRIESKERHNDFERQPHARSRSTRTLLPAPASAPTTSASHRHPPRRRHPADRISIDDFMKVELRVAKVLAAERVPKSKKLLKLSGRRRHRAAHARRRHRRGVRAGGAGRTIRRHRVQPAAGQADGHRVERHGARGEPRRRQARARDLRTAAGAGDASPLAECVTARREGPP